MKISTKQKIWGIGLLALLPILYFIQGKQIVSEELLQEMEVVFQNARIKQDRIYRGQLFFKNQEDNFVTNPVTYKAWDRIPFQNKVKAGDVLFIKIFKKEAALLKNGQEDKINLVAITAQKNERNYLSLEDYNLYHQLSFMKFYVFWGMAFMIYLFQLFRSNKKQTE